MADYDPVDVEAHEHEAWQSAAPIYAEHVAILTAESGQFEIIRDVGDLANGDLVLDVGCGPGILTRKIADVVSEVIGVDFCSNMIAEAQRTNSSLRFERANTEKLPFSSNYFDVAVVNYVAHHLARPEKAFAEIRRVLKSGGRLIIIHPIQSRQPAWGSFADAVAEVLPPETVPGGALLHVAEPQEYIDLLDQCGFKQVSCSERVKPVVLSRLESLMESGWIIAGLASQPSDVQERIAAAVRRRAAPYRQGDGTYSFPDVVLVAHATA